MTGVWRAEGWKRAGSTASASGWSRVLGTNVDINRLFERLQPARWTGDDIADAFWTFFLRNVYGATAFPDVVDVKRELSSRKPPSRNRPAHAPPPRRAPPGKTPNRTSSATSSSTAAV